MHFVTSFEKSQSPIHTICVAPLCQEHMLNYLCLSSVSHWSFASRITQNNTINCAVVCTNLEQVPVPRDFATLAFPTFLACFRVVHGSLQTQKDSLIIRLQSPHTPPPTNSQHTQTRRTPQEIKKNSLPLKIW